LKGKLFLGNVTELPFAVRQTEGFDTFAMRRDIRAIWFKVERWEAESIHRREGRDCCTPRLTDAGKSKEVLE
jgi:hypothetical protein